MEAQTETQEAHCALQAQIELWTSQMEAKTLRLSAGGPDRALEAEISFWRFKLTSSSHPKVKVGGLRLCSLSVELGLATS